MVPRLKDSNPVGKKKKPIHGILVKSRLVRAVRETAEFLLIVAAVVWLR